MWERISGALFPIILCIISLVFAVAGFNAGSRDLSDMSLVSGKVTVTKGAVDDELGVTTNAPVMIRVVEMYQYVKTSDKSYRKEYSDTHEPMIEVNGYTYDNPAFPSNIENKKYFFGEAVIGDDNLKIADELLTKFTFGSYIYFDDSYRSEDYRLPKKFVDKTGYGLVMKNGMIQSNDSSETVGHIRIRYYTGYPRKNQVFTVHGNIDGDTIGTESISAIYDRAMDESELEKLNEEFSSSNNTVGIVASIFTVIFLGIALRSMTRD